jgi:RimJ/RimL family protein N-acetyltransferase
MIITKGNLKFIKLKEEDIELVRRWRNSPTIAQFMEFREYITPEQQLQWFRSVNNKNNLYFVIEYDFKKVGLINGKDIDWSTSTMEVGIFFWEESLYSTPLPALSSLVFSEIGVVYGGLTAMAHILRDNHRAIRYNREIGFELCEGQEEVENQKYILTKERYIHKARRLRKAFFTLINRDPSTMLFEKEDYDLGIAQLVEESIDPDWVDQVIEQDGGKLYLFKSDTLQTL